MLYLGRSRKASEIPCQYEIWRFSFSSKSLLYEYKQLNPRSWEHSLLIVYPDEQKSG